ncbi:MAG: hypothetical protein C4334_13955 [Pyrinomonas sp.]|uniref:FAD-binding oxidoreductase n=1 Tax=Pyrinomonas sp. TaxID=2080306 RepID=UPI00331C85B1
MDSDLDQQTGLRVLPTGPRDAVDGLVPRAVVEPEDVEGTARFLAWASRHGRRVVVRGGGTKLHWGNRPGAVDLILSTVRLERLIEHAWADMTATVEAGCTVAALQRRLAERGQRLALDPLFADRATVGGVIATNDSGALRLRYGSVRDHLLGVRLVLADGTIARSGGKVVKNVAGYDLPKLMTGALGTLGVIVEATFRLYPLPSATRTLSLALDSLPRANELALAILDSTLAPASVQIRADSGSSGALLDVRFEGPPAAVGAQMERVRVLGRSATVAGEDDGVWRAREEQWDEANALVCKLSVLRSRLADAIECAARVAERHETRWHAVAQAFGLITLAFGHATAALIAELRAALAPTGASCVVLRAPLEVKKQVDVWGSAGDASFLMRRLREQFDPQRTLNPGRFVGGI